jgi:hypothetical protein
MSNDKKPLPLGQPPQGSRPGEATPTHVLAEILRVAAERKCINPTKRLIFDSNGRVVNRIFQCFN